MLELASFSQNMSLSALLSWAEAFSPIALTYRGLLLPIICSHTKYLIGIWISAF